MSAADTWHHADLGDRQGDGERDAEGDQRLHIEFVGIRGGQGTSTVAAVTALILGETYRRVLLESHDPESAAALLGCAAPSGMRRRLTDTVELASELSPRPADGVTALVSDWGHVGPASEAAERAVRRHRIGVLRGPCYVALRTLVGVDTAHWAGLVLVSEAGRALDRRDVEDITGLTVLATIGVTPAVARTLDGGLASARLARMREFAQVRPWLTSLVPGPSFSLDRGAPGAVASRSEPVETTCTDWLVAPEALPAVVRASSAQVGTARGTVRA